MDLTKDSKKVICCAYKIYLERRKNGITRDSAKLFELNFYNDDKNLSNWAKSDISNCLEELENSGYVSTYIDGSFILLDDAIKEMESRFKKGIVDVTDFITKFL